VSVDTYLKRKNLAPYTALQYEGVRILLAPSLIRWAKAVHLGTKQFLIWRSFAVEAEHKHGPTCAH
jgi:hypothetical protein